MCTARSRRVIEVYGVITQIESKLILIMEYAKNGSLRAKLSEDVATPLAKEMALGLIADISYGMKYLYSKGIHHRDLKADNVLLDRDMIAKVSDFGLSKADALITSAPTKSSKVGTPAWQSPEELYAEDEIDEKCDVYSFGILLYEMMTCEVPWEGMNAGKIISAVLRNERPTSNKSDLIKHTT